MAKQTIILLFLSAFSAATGQLLFKVGADGRNTIQEFINLPIISGIIMYAIGTIIWIYVLSDEKLVNVYAFTALSFVLVYLGGVLLLGEKLVAAGVVGVILVLAGLFLIVTYNA